MQEEQKAEIYDKGARDEGKNPQLKGYLHHLFSFTHSSMNS